MNNLKKNVKEIVMTIIAMTAFVVGAAPLAGTGSAEDPFLISSVEDLQEFAASVNNGETTYNNTGVTVALTADLDLDGVEFPGIGTEEFCYIGTFDGCNFKISNFAANDEGMEEPWAIGFFRFLGDWDHNEGAVKNLKVVNLTLSSGDDSDATAFVAICNAGVVDNVKVSGDIAVAGFYDVSGLVGWADYAEISNCSVSGRSGSYVDGFCTVGGLLAYANGVCSISNSKVSGVDVTGEVCVDNIVGDVWGECQVENTRYVAPMLFGGFGAGNAEPEEEVEEEEEEEEYVMPTHEGVEAIDPEMTEIPFEGIMPETEYGEDYFAEVRDFADYLATNGCNCAEFMSEDLNLFRFANWVAGVSGAATVEELLSTKNLFAAYAFNQRYDAFANVDPSFKIEVLKNIPEDGYSTIIMHVKAGEEELDVTGINANVVLKYREQLTDDWSEFGLAEECIEIVGTLDGHSRATLVIPPPEGSSAFFSVSVL